MTKHVALAVAGLTLLIAMAPTASAAPQWHGQLTTQSLVTQGQTETAGSLRALFRFDPLTDSAVLPSGHFNLAAEAVHVETQEGDPVLVGAPGALNGVVAQKSTTMDYRFANITGLQTVRGSYLLEIMPWAGHPSPSLKSESTCIEVKPADREAALSQPMVNFSRDYSMDVSSAILWQDCSLGSQLVVEGWFMVILWEWDCQIEANGQSVLLKSGYDQSESAAALGGFVYPAVATSRQQYLFVENGRLEFPSMDSTSHVAFIEKGAIAAGNASFVGTIGQLSNGHVDRDLTASTLTLRGDMALSFAPQASNDRLELGLTGTVNSGEADGQPLSFVVAPTSGPDLWPLLLVGMVGLVAVPSVLVVPRRIRAVRQRHLAGLLYRCDRLFERYAFAEMRAVAIKALDLSPREPEAHMQLARALEQLGDFDMARGHRDEANAILRQRGNALARAENALQAAHAAADNQSETDALRWIRIALQANPALRDEMTQVPTLERLLGHLEMPTEKQPFWLQP